MPGLCRNNFVCINSFHLGGRLVESYVTVDGLFNNYGTEGELVQSCVKSGVFTVY